MSEVQAHRTLVKSPPELWEEISDPEALARHLEGFGDIRITRTEPETTVAWEGEQVHGTVTIAASGWGTQVSLHARIAVPEPPPAPVPPPPDPVEHIVRVVDQRLVRIELPAAPEPEPEPGPEAEADPEPVVAAPAARGRFFSRLFRRAPQPEPEPDPVPEPAPAPPPERRRQRPPCELRVVQAVVACRVPRRPAPPPPPAMEPAFDPERAESVLAEVLDHLGAAHHRPFSRT
ncbi:MAG TPA: hypothetical protein VGN78_04190 [Solirubrobacteraceae bacterium]|nr:hypothetical protein [Solirubrobacteraceae bacterium]